jgi:8-oxo-dGTP pyrophosphatase MutT (NUDIX family)
MMARMSAIPANWTAIAAARDCRVERVPFEIEGCVVGSVARTHLEALRAFGDAIAVEPDRVALTVREEQRDAAFAHINNVLRAAGLIVAWRDESYTVQQHPQGPVLARIERASSRFWGTLTFGAHCNGYVAAANGRPTHLWIAQRAFTKPTDPGLFDNLVGGGVPAGQSPAETLVREGWEEAGLTPQQMEHAQPGRVMRLWRDIPEGFQHEWLYAFDLQLPHGLQPRNQDGEVHALQLMAVQEALALAATDRMTVDASLVTLDFALRHRLLGEAHHGLQTAFEPLLADTASTFQGI